MIFINSIVLFALQCLYLILPAAAANIAPALGKNLFKKYAYPVDLNYQWRGKPLFGAHKTYKGFVLGIAVGIFIAAVQTYVYRFPLMQSISYINYAEHSFIIVGFLLGFGALFGDLIKSFFKRRVGIESGKPFIPFDQVDFVIGALVFISFIKPPSWQMIIFYLIIMPILHIATNLFAYGLGLQKNKI